MGHDRPSPGRCARQLVRQVRQIVAPWLAADGCIVLAVSGGSDSMALLHLVWQAWFRHQPDRELRCCVACFDHGMRAESADECEMVGRVAHGLGLAFRTARWGTPAACGSGNVQERAREARYRFLHDCAREFHATHIATGHQMDDQAETVLDRLLRSGGVRGLAGMQPERRLYPDSDIWLVRPLLPFRRHVLRRWLQGMDLAWCEDPGNQSLHYRRSCLRTHVLPVLTQCVGRDPVGELARAAGRAAQADAALEWLGRQVFPTLDWFVDADGSGSLARLPLAALPDETIVRCLLHGMTRLTPAGAPVQVGGMARDALLRLVRQGNRHWCVRLAGCEVRRDRDRIVLTPVTGPVERKKKHDLPISVPIV